MDNGFAKIEQTERQMYGPRKLLLCGFTAQQQPVLTEALSAAGLGDIGCVFVGDAHLNMTLGELMDLPDHTGAGTSSSIQRAVIMSGITEKELHALMAAHRGADLPRPLWAALTETSEGWTLEALLSELSAERRELWARNP